MRLTTALKFFALLLFVIVLGFGGFAPAHAATGNISHSPQGDLVGPTCDFTFVGFNYSITGTTNDGGGIDNVIAVARDGYWNYLFAEHGFFPVGVTGSNVFNVFLGGIKARPVIVQLIDTDATFNPATGNVVYEFAFDPATINPACAGLPYLAGISAALNDGRINHRPEDNMQTAAIYCTTDGGVTIWAVTNGVGKFAFTATRQEIDVVPKNPAKNTLIKQAKNIALYRLTSGELQVNAPNGYFFIWKSC